MSAIKDGIKAVNPKMRITIITSSYPRYPGDGTAPFVKSIAEGLANLGNDVEVVAPYDAEVETSTAKDIPVYRFHYIWPRRWHIMGHARTLYSDFRLRPAAFLLLPSFLFFSTYRLLRVVQKNKSQLIYAHWILPNGIPAAIISMLKRIPLAISLHGSDVYLATSNPFYSFITRQIIRRANFITACSEEMYQDAIKFGAERKVHLLAWGADPTQFKPYTGSNIENPAQNTTDNKIVFSCLGRLVHKKGFQILIQAMSEVVNVYPEVHLKIGGEGPLKNPLLNEVHRLGIEKNVSLVGRVPWDQVPSFLQETDVFVLPSIRDHRGNVDGLPTVLLEAMSTAKPVIASRIGGVPLVIENNVNGLIFEAGDIQSLAKLMMLLASDATLRKRLGLAARKSICEKHNWRQVCSTLAKYFNNAIQEK